MTASITQIYSDINFIANIVQLYITRENYHFQIFDSFYILEEFISYFILRYCSCYGIMGKQA
jgi:hypothetical protein